MLTLCLQVRLLQLVDPRGRTPLPSVESAWPEVGNTLVASWRVIRRAFSPAQGVERLVQVLGPDQDVACLGALARPDDIPALQQVHQPSRLGAADPQLALQHRRRPEL